MKMLKSNKLSHVVKTVEDAFCKQWNLGPGPGFASELLADRKSGAPTDPNARVFDDKYHQFLTQLSKPELIDLACEFLSEDYSKESNTFDWRLMETVVDILNIRFMNRHPLED